ncbi:MAG: transcriptional regulator [Culicoidibacterales bacterium]
MNYEELPSLLTVSEVAYITRFKYGAAAKIVRDLNELLTAQGYFVLRGRVSKDFLFEKLNLNREGLVLSEMNMEEYQWNQIDN